MANGSAAGAPIQRVDYVMALPEPQAEADHEMSSHSDDVVSYRSGSEKSFGIDLPSAAPTGAGTPP